MVGLIRTWGICYNDLGEILQHALEITISHLPEVVGVLCQFLFSELFATGSLANVELALPRWKCNEA